MRIFVCEYITGGGMLHETIPASLAREGDLMARALARDLADVENLELVVSRDPRLAPLPVRATVAVDTPQDIWPTWRAIISDVDAVWPIAPETDGVLQRLSAEVLAQKRVLLGSRPDALAVAASKSATSERLAHAGLRVVPTYPVVRAPLETASSWVVKPDDGVGCVGTRRCSAQALRRGLAQNSVPANYVAQPYVEGAPVSVSLICRGGRSWVLSCNRQRVEQRGGEFRLRGVVVNGVTDRVSEFEEVATRIAAALPGLWGYVGVDLVQGSDDLWILEINPRLTTSYVGLRASLGVNPAALVLNLSREDPLLPDRERNRVPVDVDVELGCAA